MARYEIEGVIVDTNNATNEWDERTDWDGRNHISRATGSQWDHQNLYRSRKGRYYIVHQSQWQGSKSWAEWVSPQAATVWLLKMEHEVPKDLEEFVEQISE